ncbi:hypothetical protein P8C59_007639 [Phyllachora maydis]|uniref:lytic cellulose monooxygenase (C4-dehydrogenating) n=1 Tax=Phyllachora maydis TaxID=1825666 RepID=A0AAD9MFS1_9PEZI|nr:hypothetical protein P8C59_007639 [Phyllachora maydis]
MNVPVPVGLANGDYQLRAEALALHTVMSAAGVQFSMTCYRTNVSGGGGGGSTVSIPGAYAAADPGILANIHLPLSPYTAPGPDV